VTDSKRIALFSIFVLLASQLCAQLTGTKIISELQNSGKGGTITITQNEDITKLVDRHLYEEGKKKGLAGYRIRLYSASGAQARKEGEMVMSSFLSKYENTKPYFGFDTPNWRLYVGDFRTQSEAVKLLKVLERDFPDAFIVRSKINYPPLYTE
jgi:hypothetical protein